MAFAAKPAWFPDLRGPHLDTRLCFFHVPKCAGLSVVRSMRDKYRLRDHLRGRLTSIDAAASLRGAELSGADLIEYRKDLLAYLLARDDLLFVTGHVGCNGRIVEAFGGKWMFATILRDPVSRFLSEYFYNRFKESDHFKTALSLDEYLEDPAGEAGANTYLNLFSGLARTAPVDDRIEDALGNLSRFDLVGHVEELPEFRDRFAARTGVALRAIRHNVNPAPGYEEQRNVPAASMAAIESLCAGDIELVRRLRKLDA